MSMSSQLVDVFARVGMEFIAVRSAIEQRYAKPAGGIPLEDLAAGVQDKFNPAMTQAMAQTGTGTSLNSISPAVLKGAINYHTSNKVNAASGSLTIWTGTVANLPTTKDANTLYFAW